MSNCGARSSPLDAAGGEPTAGESPFSAFPSEADDSTINGTKPGTLPASGNGAPRIESTDPPDTNEAADDGAAGEAACGSPQTLSIAPPSIEFQGTLVASTPYLHPNPSEFAPSMFFEEGLPYPVRDIAGEFIALPASLSSPGHRTKGVWGEASDDVFIALSGTTAVARWAGGQWQMEPLLGTDGEPTSDSIESITGDGAGRLWAVGKALYQRNDAGQWLALKLPSHAYPLRSAWIGVDGFGVALSDVVFVTFDAGSTWKDDTRNVGMFADGMAERRLFRRVDGYRDQAAIVTDDGEMLLRAGERWQAYHLDAKDVHLQGNGIAVANDNALLVEGDPTRGRPTPLPGVTGVAKAVATTNWSGCGAHLEVTSTSPLTTKA